MDFQHLQQMRELKTLLDQFFDHLAEPISNAEIVAFDHYLRTNANPLKPLLER